MMTKTKKQHKANGAALILVVVVTVLLAVIGVMFLMVSRVSEMETASVADQRDLDAAVRTVTNRINEVLVQDLFGLTRPTDTDAFTYGETMLSADETAVGTDALNIHADEPYDYSSNRTGAGVAGVIGPGPDGIFNNADDIWLPGQYDDFWLASLEPVYNNNGTPANLADDYYEWPHITDLWGTIQATPDSLYLQQYVQADHGVFFAGRTNRFYWVDPANRNAPATWDEQTAAGAWKWQVSASNVPVKVIAPGDRMDIVAIIGATVPTSWENAASETDVRLYGARADADGDGVADSRWVPIPGLTTSRGKPVYAAVRIIDNNAMLNLNVATCFDVRGYNDADKTSPFKEAWSYRHEEPVNNFELRQWHDNQGQGSGRYLTEMNYLPFLRGRDLNGNLFAGTAGGDDWYNLMVAKGFYKSVGGFNYPFAPKISHDIVMNIENPGFRYHFFDITDELELRNRYMLTSNVEARFERADIANFSLDSGSTDYAALKVPRDADNPISIWYERIDPTNFDAWSGGPIPYKYDRRHVSTFYSYDRNLRRGLYPVLEHDFAVLTSLPGWTAQRIEMAQKVFWPLGAVTTNIENPASSQPYNTYNNVETRRRILHLLFALRAYYLPDEFEQLTPAELASLTAGQQEDLRQAALKAAQVVANLIDYSDDDALNTLPVRGAKEGPFYETIYGEQANVDCTFITEQIINDMIEEVSGYYLGTASAFSRSFGLEPTDIVFGYERQPFISEVYAKWDNSTGVFEGFAVELLNPYSKDIKPKPDSLLPGWKLKVGDGSVVDDEIGDDIFDLIPAYDTTAKSPGRYVIRSSTAVTLASGPLAALTYEMPDLSNLGTLFPLGNYEIQLLRPAPEKSGVDYIIVDRVPSSDVASLFVNGENALKRDDQQWRFLYDSYETQQESAGNFTLTLGQPNEETQSVAEEFQLAVADDGYPLSRWHELEVLSLFGNRGDDGDPNDAITGRIAAAADAGEMLHFNITGDSEDLAGDSEDLLDYLCTMNRPDIGTLPGRININTAPVHVIAAAIPPVLADPNAADPDETVTFSALDLARQIVNRRNAHGPYTKLSDLLKIDRFKQYDAGGEWADENVGMQSIEHDIEARHWILSNLANKFTVRSDVFTAYILVRLGETGPQRRMIAIFDRSDVWQPGDRPKLVALHPVPDPR
jgi:hypothetical protein